MVCLEDAEVVTGVTDSDREICRSHVWENSRMSPLVRREKTCQREWVIAVHLRICNRAQPFCYAAVTRTFTESNQFTKYSCWTSQNEAVISSAGVSLMLRWSNFTNNVLCEKSRLNLILHAPVGHLPLICMANFPNYQSAFVMAVGILSLKRWFRMSFRIWNRKIIFWTAYVNLSKKGMIVTCVIPSFFNPMCSRCSSQSYGMDWVSKYLL